MPFNVQTFKTRTLTAIVFAAVMLVGLFWNLWSFLVLFTIIHFGCWYEYLKLIEKVYNSEIDIVIKWFFAICGFALAMVLGLQTMSFDFYFFVFNNKISLKWMIWCFMLLCQIIFITQNKKINSKAKWACFAGFVYVTLPIACLIHLYIVSEYTVVTPGWHTTYYSTWIYPAAIIFSIWINDTMAYIVGSLIGKTPFSKISPKKTWEGTAGGGLLCVVVISLIAYFTNYISVKDAIFISALSAIFGTIGDLFESKLKRLAGVKDSGNFMPGHGGFLDRFDSLLFAVPAVWVYVMLVK